MKTIIKEKGKKPLVFQKGGLHKSTNTPMGKTIPQAKFSAALKGSDGPKAKKQALMAKNVFGKK
jgi:hypothetical protein